MPQHASAIQRRPHYNVTFAVLAVGIGAYALLQSMVAPVLPTIQENLHTTQATVTWVMTAYLLSASIATCRWRSASSVTSSRRKGFPPRSAWRPR